MLDLILVIGIALCLLAYLGYNEVSKIWCKHCEKMTNQDPTFDAFVYQCKRCGKKNVHRDSES